MDRREFLLAVPAVAVIASRSAALGHDLDRRLLNRCLARALAVFCQTCGAPAATLCRDVYEVEPVDGTRAYRLCDPLKAGCHSHPVESLFYDRSGAIDVEAKVAADRFHAEVLESWRK